MARAARATETRACRAEFRFRRLDRSHGAEAEFVKYSDHKM